MKLQDILSIIVALVVFVPLALMLAAFFFQLLRSGAWKKIINDDVPERRTEAINRLADSIEHLAHSFAGGEHD